MLREEAQAECNAIRHAWRLNPNAPKSSLAQIYIQGYQRGAVSGPRTPAREQASHFLGFLRVLHAFKRGTVLTSTTSETYQEYYEKLWQAAQHQQEVASRPQPSKRPFFKSISTPVSTLPFEKHFPASDIDLSLAVMMQRSFKGSATRDAPVGEKALFVGTLHPKADH